MKPYYITFKSLDDAKPSLVLKQNQSTIKEVEEYVEINLSKEQKDHLKNALALIKDFETPFGLELLGTIDFIFDQKKEVLSSTETLNELKNWTDRKRKLFKPFHIDVAKEKLQEYFSYS
jgi:hypothetical protein